MKITNVSRDSNAYSIQTSYLKVSKTEEKMSKLRNRRLKLRNMGEILIFLKVTKNWRAEVIVNMDSRASYSRLFRMHSHQKDNSMLQ